MSCCSAKIAMLTGSTNRGRTPKWAIKAGLINMDERDRKTRKNQWSKRFDERNNQSTHIGQDLEEGESGDNYVPISEQEREAERRRQREGLWDDNEDTEYYNEGESGVLPLKMGQTHVRPSTQPKTLALPCQL